MSSISLAAAVVACFLLGRYARSSIQVVAGAALAIGAFTVAGQLAPEPEYSPLDDLVFFALLLGTPATIGRLLRQRAGLIARLDERATALRAAREVQAAAAVAEERAAAAIGVHDALAHRIGEITLQAAGVQRVAAAEPGLALAALARIEAAGRAALDDIRDVIGVLRSGDELALGRARVPAEAVPAPWSAPGHGGVPVSSRPRNPYGDRLIAAAVFAAFAIETTTSARIEGPVLANVAGCAAVAAPLLLRRRAPLASAAGVYGAAAIQSLFLTPLSLLVTPIALLIIPSYAVAAHLPLARALTGLMICAAGTLALGPSVATGVVGLLAFVAGRVVRSRGVRLAELHRLTAELERAGDTHAARARGEERLRIARELHDAIAHDMTVVVLQAGAAQRVWTSDRAAALEAVEALTGVARATLSELRVTLRGSASARLDALDQLVERVRALGLDVDVSRERQAVPAGLESVAYAVIQEALTNAVRHAGPTAVRVTLRSDGEALIVGVADSGRRTDLTPAPSTLGSGSGLSGMAERVTAAGGTLRYGAHGEGFRVEARLPLRLAVVA